MHFNLLNLLNLLQFKNDSRSEQAPFKWELNLCNCSALRARWSHEVARSIKVDAKFVNYLRNNAGFLRDSITYEHLRYADYVFRPVGLREGAGSDWLKVALPTTQKGERDNFLGIPWPAGEPLLPGSRIYIWLTSDGKQTSVDTCFKRDLLLTFNPRVDTTVLNKHGKTAQKYYEMNYKSHTWKRDEWRAPSKEVDFKWHAADDIWNKDKFVGLKIHIESDHFSVVSATNVTSTIAEFEGTYAVKTEQGAIFRAFTADEAIAIAKAAKSNSTQPSDLNITAEGVKGACIADCTNKKRYEIADGKCEQLAAEVTEIKTVCAWKGALLEEAKETIGDIQQKLSDTQWELEAIKTKIQILTESAATNWYRR